MQWCLLQWHHMNQCWSEECLLVMALVPMVTHDQENDITPCFDHLDLTNAVVSLTMLSASCDVDAGTSAITTDKSC